MRKYTFMVASLALLALTATAFAADEAKPDVKPITKVMLARLGWVQSLTKNVAYSNYEAIAKDANELAAQTKKVGDAAPAAFNKERNLTISSLSLALADAAAKKDGAAASAKLGEILGTCNSCHAKLRDK
jgi:cytochrome c556